MANSPVQNPDAYESTPESQHALGGNALAVSLAFSFTNTWLPTFTDIVTYPVHTWN